MTKLEFEHLISPLKLAGAARGSLLQLKHRVVMAPLTRTRNDPLTYAPRHINALYYTQRTSDGGLIITEATAVSASAEGYLRAPGMYTEAHIDGWRLVTDAVHAKGEENQENLDAEASFLSYDFNDYCYVHYSVTFCQS